MFEAALLDSTARSRNQRRWTALLSVAVQMALAGVLLMLPMIAPESIPDLRSRITVTVPRAEAASPEPRAEPAGGSTAKPPRPDQVVLQQPPEVPATIHTGPDDVAETPSSNLPVRNCAGRCGGGIRGGVPGGDLVSDYVPTVREQPAATTTTLVVSAGVTEGMILHRVQPIYPPAARLARVQGQVVIQALISREGEIRGLRVVSGHPMLSRAAMDAVKQWRYRPYLLNHKPVEVETQITVKFFLSGS